MPAVAIRAYTATTALGQGLRAQAEALESRKSGLRHNDFGDGERLDCWIGRVAGLEPVSYTHLGSTPFNNWLIVAARPY